jgi:methionine-S-sulfoxide reductase
MDTALPEQREKATFALGCFWSPDAKFGCAPGVIRTRVGYAGGTTKAPTYHELGDHTETVEVEYDPAETSFEELVGLFWNNHNPTRKGASRQYMSAIFTQSDGQQRIAEETSGRQARETGGTVRTQITPLDTFYQAEDYHQNYKLRRYETLMDEFERIYPGSEAFIASPAASRANGYVSGYGTAQRLEEEIDGFGFTEAGKKRLRDIVR